MKFTVALSVALLALFAIVSSAKAESKRREHHVPTPHQTKEYIKPFKSAGYPEKKQSKESHHHKGYLHDDKHNHKSLKHPIEVSPHEGHMQADLRSPKNSKNMKGHDAWHKKDLHLQDLSFDSVKNHRERDVGGSHGHHTKSHHAWPHHSEPLLKHETAHHKGVKLENHKPVHHIHKSSTEKDHHHGTSASAKSLTKSYHHSDHETEHMKPQHGTKKSHGKEEDWGKNKKQKKAFEKKQKQKQHRKKQFKGELHKLW